MEVHGHTHSPRKKWTHYFWEFFMLFLAVFCGFLAEYQLDIKLKKTEKKFLQRHFTKHEKEFSSFNQWDSFSKVKIKSAENATRILRSDRSKWNDTLLYKNLTTLTTVFPLSLRTEPMSK